MNTQITLAPGFTIITLIWLMSIGGCDTCNDCGPLKRDPTVLMRFINADSLESTNQGIMTATSEVESLNLQLNSLTTELDEVRDSLQTVEQLIISGEDLAGLRDQLLIIRDSVQAIFEVTLENRTDTEERLGELNSLKTTIESGRILLDSIVSVNENTSLSFGTDSLEVFKFPLSFNSDTTAYRIFIAGLDFDLAFTYDRNFSEDERSRIEVRISNIKIKEPHDFKDIAISCEICLSDETSITAYF